MSPLPSSPVRCLVDLTAQAQLRGGAPAQNPRLRVLCCPPAGAAAGYWRFLVRDDVHVLGLQYPGRESRLREPAAASVPALAEEAAPAVAAAPWARSGVPLAVLGHSMGAAVAAELASLLEHRHGIRTAVLALSGQAAPGAGGGQDPPDDDGPPCSDDDLVRWLRRLGGTPEAVLADPELLALQLPALRADLRLAAAHDRLPAPVRAPLLLLRGTEDDTVAAAGLGGWRAVSSGPVQLREYPGGHHPLAAHRDRLLADLVACAAADGTR